MSGPVECQVGKDGNYWEWTGTRRLRRFNTTRRRCLRYLFRPLVLHSGGIFLERQAWGVISTALILVVLGCGTAQWRNLFGASGMGSHLDSANIGRLRVRFN
jgi:hypothetical protein